MSLNANPLPALSPTSLDAVPRVTGRIRHPALSLRLISIDAAFLCRPSGNARCPEAVRLRQAWRHRIFSSVARLVRLRAHANFFRLCIGEPRLGR